MHIEATCLNTRVTGSGNLQKLGSGCGAHYGVLAFETTPCVDLTVRTWFRKVHQVQARFGPSPNPEPDFGSGSAPMLNFGLDLGPVHQGSGPDQSSEPNCGNTIHAGGVGWQHEGKHTELGGEKLDSRLRSPHKKTHCCANFPNCRG